MFYIEPNSKIRFLKQVPLDDSYTNTIYFATVSAQTDYFKTKTKGYTTLTPNPAKYALGTQSYSRPSRGWVQVEIPADDLYDCNYLMFQNTSYGNKWFYGFIDEVEYINNNVSRVHYKLDLMQTWAFNADGTQGYTFEKCFVEREHTATDTIGDNLVPEPVNTGLYVTGPGYTTGLFDPATYKILVMATCGLNSVFDNMMPAEGGFLAGVYQAIEYRSYEPTAVGISALKTFLTTFPLFGNSNNICLIGMVPTSILPPGTIFDNSVGSMTDTKNRLMRLKFNTNDTTNFNNIPIRRNAANVFGGYVPKNNKLYTYPYNYFIVTNQEGEQKEFAYEHFDPVAGIVFQLIPDYGVQPTVLCAPYGYKEKRVGNDLTAWRTAVSNNTAMPNLNYAMYLRGFPRSAWATSDVIAKLTQMTMSAAMIAAGAATANPMLAMSGVSMGGGPNMLPSPHNPETVKVGGITGAYYHGKKVEQNNQYKGKDWEITTQDTAAQIASVIGHNVMNIETNGIPGQPNALFSIGGIDFIFRQVFLDYQYAEIVDNYFTMYGYQINKVKIPNRTARPHWNYIKTKDCQIIAAIPASHAKQICEIYNNGITFWKNGSEVGNYDLDNSPV